MNIKITTTLIAIWLLHIAAPLFAQTYTVVKARGQVSLQSNSKKILKREDKFKAGPLQFATTKDFLVVLDGKEAAFLLYPDATLKKYKAKSLPPVGTKPGLILNDLQLRQFLNENDSLLLFNGRFSLILGEEAFPMDENHFFYVQYMWKGDTIAKRLGHRSDTLLIEAKELYKVDNNPVDPKEVSEKCTFWYHNEQTKESVEYPGYSRPIYIISANDEAIKAEVQMLLRPYRNQDFHIRMRVASTYLSRFYGVVGDWELEQLLKELNP
jgi:hypothetical protein